MGDSRIVDWGPRPSDGGRTPTRPVIAVPAVPKPPKRRWPVWVAIALVGATVGAVLAGRIMGRQATPERLRDKTAVEKRATPEPDGRVFEGENTRIQFKKTDKTKDAEPDDSIEPRDPSGPMY